MYFIADSALKEETADSALKEECSVSNTTTVVSDSKNKPLNVTRTKDNSVESRTSRVIEPSDSKIFDFCFRLATELQQIPDEACGRFMHETSERLKQIKCDFAQMMNKDT